MMKSLRQMAVTNSVCVEGMNWRLTAASLAQSSRHNTAIANLAVVRGSQPGTAPIEYLQSPELYASWVPEPLTVWRSSISTGKHDKSVTLVSNNRGVHLPIGRAISRAWTAFNAKAFLHQYDHYG